MFNRLVVIFIFVFAGSLIISNVFKLILARKNRKENQEYLKFIEEKMKDISKQISKRGSDLQESMDMLNREYSRMMKPGEKARFDFKGGFQDKKKMREEGKKHKGKGKSEEEKK